MKWDKNIEVEWDVPDFLEILEDDYSKRFALAEFSSLNNIISSPFSSGIGRGKENYIKRIEAIGFTGKKRILDAGCGMGQWSYVMSIYNDEIVAVDQSEHRLKIAKYLNRKRNNILFQKSDIEKLSFNNDSFDCIFCYGVFMFTDMLQSLEVFRNLLKKKGIIFLNFNNIGHYLDRIIYYTNVQNDDKLVAQFRKMVDNYYQGNYKNSLMTIEKMEKILSNMGLRVIYSGYDGQSAELPFYKTNYYGFPYVSEMIIEK